MSGDHLLARIVPLPGLEPSDTGTAHRNSLGEYLTSLPRFVALDPTVVLPGHGEAFTGVDVLARRLVAHHADRCAAVRSVVAELGNPTPFEVTQRLLWQADGSRLLRGVADVVGHLDLLAHDGDVVVEAKGARSATAPRANRMPYRAGQPEPWRLAVVGARASPPSSTVGTPPRSARSSSCRPMRAGPVLG